jgi:hypothetical protein
MKKTMFFIFTIAAFLVSCSSNELAGLATLSPAASASITSYITNNYPGTTIYTSSVSGSTLMATLNTGEQVSFTKSGVFMSYANNFNLGLKADSLDITNDSIPFTGHDGGMGHGGMMGGGPGHGGPDGHGGMNGKGPGMGGPNGPGYGGPVDSTHVMGNEKPGHHRHFKNEIVVDSLPTVINTYISTNYSGYAVIHAEVDTICSGAVTEVFVCNRTSEPVKLVFDATGTYLYKAARMLFADVPAAVTAAITANYSTYTVTHRVEKFILADGSLEYKLFMILNNMHKMVTFNATGIVVCEK